MSDTYATLKRMVANRLGFTNDATADTLRDNAIIDAAKQIYQDADFSWLRKKNDVVMTAGVGNLPADFNINFGVTRAYRVVTGTENNEEYTQCTPEAIDDRPTSEFLFYLTYDADNKVFVITTNQTTSFTLRVWYKFVPADLSGSTDVTPIPDSSCIRDLAVAFWWLSAERDEQEHDRWYNTRYLPRLNKMITNDKAHNTPRRALVSHLDLSSGESILATRR